jgi:phosphoenolpyruvate synthase/pyruvate phosphate dikinase
MKTVIPLEEASETSLFGSKAVGLGEAARGGIPLPPGVALSGDLVEAVASGEADAVEQVEELVRSLPCPLAVRSSAVDEDGAEASFAGQHLTLLNVPSPDEVDTALKEIWWSANSDSAITYRQRVGLFTRPSVGVVVMSLVDPDVAGVMFTKNPINGADERMIEASWGLGEAVVAGQVIPDNFRIARSGEVLERTPGRKDVAIRRAPEGGTIEEQVAPELVEELCLDDDQLAEMNRLADRCEEVYGPGRDIEFAFADGQLYLLQCRAVTRAGSTGPAKPDASPTPNESIKEVELFAGLNQREAAQVAGLLKERRFSKGETVCREGSGGSALYLIISGEATVSIAGKQIRTLRPGDYFGEIALIDEGERSATVTASTDLVCDGLTYWDFRPLVQKNAMIGWKLLQSMVKKLRDSRRNSA